SPHLVPDRRAGEVLRRAAEQAPGPVRCCDILASAVHQDDPRVQSLLARALRRGTSLYDLLQAIPANPVTAPPVSEPRKRDGFDPAAPSPLHAIHHTHLAPSPPLT